MGETVANQNSSEARAKSVVNYGRKKKQEFLLIDYLVKVLENQTVSSNDSPKVKAQKQKGRICENVIDI